MTKAVTALPYKYRTVIVLTYFKDLPNQNVSQILNLPESTVKTRLKRAKEMLRKELEHETE